MSFFRFYIVGICLVIISNAALSSHVYAGSAIGIVPQLGCSGKLDDSKGNELTIHLAKSQDVWMFDYLVKTLSGVDAMCWLSVPSSAGSRSSEPVVRCFAPYAARGIEITAASGLLSDDGQVLQYSWKENGLSRRARFELVEPTRLQVEFKIRLQDRSHLFKGSLSCDSAGPGQSAGSPFEM